MSLERMGIQEVKMPDWRYTPGKMCPFPDGKVPPQTGQSHGSPVPNKWSSTYPKRNQTGTAH